MTSPRRPGEVGPQCTYCARVDPDSIYPRCPAFPGGVPPPIVQNVHDHRSEYPGDGGVRFEPSPRFPQHILDKLYEDLDEARGGRP